MANENRDKTHVFRKLEELNLLDDFLFQEMVSSPELGEEFCRILLRVILGREIRKVKITPQRSVLGGDTNRHGVRLDAYVEDTYIEDVSREETMEDSTVSYEDGAVKIFLYTRGTKGNPSQDLIDMLKYIEVSTEENIVNQDIKTVHDMVRRTKQKKEVGIKYMKSWELERIFTERGRAEGRIEGRTEGFAEGQFCLLCEMVQNREISLENASRKINLLPDIFATKMEEAGYKVPV